MFKFIIYLKIIRYNIFLDNFFNKLKDIYIIIIILEIIIAIKSNINIIFIFNLI